MQHKEGVDFIYDPHFLRSYKKLLPLIQKLALEKIKLFKQYPGHVGLHVHKLEGRHHNRWAFWVNYEYRVIFLQAEKIIIFYDIGTHEIYK